MRQSARRIEDDKWETPKARQFTRLSVPKFFMRYPIFLLAFGPPVFRPTTGIDITKGQMDVWSFLQAGWIAVIAVRAILRLTTARSILIPKQIRSILKYAFLLGLLFLLSTAYSSSRPATAAYSVLYFLTLICVVEFVVDVYRNPPDWVQCLFQLRLMALLLFAIVLLTLVIKPALVLAVLREEGIRLLGSAVAPVAVICPIIAIISAYSFLHSLESRFRAFLFFFVGLAGTLTTQVRGSEIALFLCLLILAVGWAKTSRRFAYIFLSGFMAFILLSGVVAGAVGPERIVKVFERGESVESLEGLSGRTEVWAFVLKYCMNHPQGMGYEAGFRVLFSQHFSLNTGLIVAHIGAAHNTFIQVLADAGWLALAIYLIMMAKIVKLAWRFAKKQTHLSPMFDRVSLHGIRCSLVLLIFCLVYGMDATEFSFPLRAGFYFLYVIVAIILGVSTRMIAASRA